MCSSVCLSSELTKRSIQGRLELCSGELVWATSLRSHPHLSCKTGPICDASSHSDSFILLLLRMPVSGKPEQERGLTFL